MKLFFDARYTRTDYHDGISRYSAELGNALAHLTEVTFLISNEKQKKWFPNDAQFIKIHSGTSIKEPFTALILNKYTPDVVYSPMQTIGTMGRSYKAVVTIHDMIYYRHNTAPRFLPAPVRIGWRLYHLAYWPQRLLLKGADLVTTVSKTTAQDLQTTEMAHGDTPVIYNAPQRFTKFPVQHEDRIKNIIYMGSFMPYKNVELLIRGMELLPGRTLHLLSKISIDRKRQLKALIPKEASVIFYNGVSDEDYEKLLANNAVLVTASLDEGFGIPVAEAMAMGVPAVTSDIPIFHEVGGDGVLYFNPNSPKSFAEAVTKLDDTILRRSLIKKADRHVKTFDWNSSAKELLEAIKSLL